MQCSHVVGRQCSSFASDFGHIASHMLACLVDSLDLDTLKITIGKTYPSSAALIFSDVDFEQFQKNQQCFLDLLVAVLSGRSVQLRVSRKMLMKSPQQQRPVALFFIIDVV